MNNFIVMFYFPRPSFSKKIKNARGDLAWFAEIIFNLFSEYEGN